MIIESDALISNFQSMINQIIRLLSEIQIHFLRTLALEGA